MLYSLNCDWKSKSYEWIYFRDRLWLYEGRKAVRSTGLDIYFGLLK